MLHAKHLSIDDDVAIIGSSNMDIRSLSLHMELMVLVHGAEFVDALRKVEDDYRAKSRQLRLDEWLRRPAPGEGVRQPRAAHLIVDVINERGEPCCWSTAG